MRNRLGYLYFITSKAQAAVKVGYADNVDSRLPGLQSGNPSPLEVFIAIPIHSDAERIFHTIMKPHRIVREWYPDDSLMNNLGCELIEVWGDKVQEVNGGGFDAWLQDRDEWLNAAGVFLTPAEMKKTVERIIRDFFNPKPDELEPGDDDHLTITNHWLPEPKRRARKLRPGYA